MICWAWRQNVARGRRPRATFCLKVQHIICCPNPQSIIVLLYLHWFRIKYNIQTIIHNQTDHDQTGLNLDDWELIYYELALVWINSNNITPVHVIQFANNKLTQLRFRTKWIQNESTCLWRQTRHSGPTYVFICPRSNIDFYMPAASNIYYRDYIYRNL